MKILKSPIRIMAINIIYMSSIFFVTFALTYDDSSVNLSNNIFLLLFFLLGICLYIYSICLDRTKRNLKSTGLSYEAKIIELLPVRLFKITNFFSFRAKCNYYDNAGNMQIITSDLLYIRKSKAKFFIDNSGLMPDVDYKAVAYVNPINSENYYLEISAELKSGLWFR